MQEKPRILYYAPAISWGIFISFMTLMPGSAIPKDLAELNDKYLHGVIYFFTAGLIILGSIRYNHQNVLKKGRLISVVLFCFLFGGIIEILQHALIPGRNGSWLDFLANDIGAVLAALFWLLFKKLKAYMSRSL